MADTFEQQRKKMEKRNLNIKIEKGDGGTILHGDKFGEASQVFNDTDADIEKLRQVVNDELNKFIGKKVK